MRPIAPASAATLVAAIAAIFLLAQEAPLGDVARQARAQKQQSPRATKVLTSEDSNPVAVTDKDDPVEVVSKARIALLGDTAHRCHRETSGNSGPGWGDVRVVEVAGPDRIHITLEDRRPQATRNELILIGNDGYRRQGNGPWEKMSEEEAARMAGYVQAFQLPDVLQFGFTSGELKLVGREVIDGMIAFQYQYSVHSSALERTINIWVGSGDGLPRKTQMQTHDPSMGTSWQETTSCSYGVRIKIEPPI